MDKPGKSPAPGGTPPPGILTPVPAGTYTPERKKPSILNIISEGLIFFFYMKLPYTEVCYV